MFYEAGWTESFPKTILTSFIYQSASKSFPGDSEVKNLSTQQERQVWSLGGEDPLEKGMATHSRILAWEILGTEERDGLQSMGW